MNGKRLGLLVLSSLVIVLAASFCLAAVDNEQQQLDQYLSDLKKNPFDTALREKIINHVRTMKKAPAIPEAAERAMARGKIAFERAMSRDGFGEAAAELRKATDEAPWLAIAYYNLGLARENAEDFANAIASFKLYLLAAPAAKDAQAVKTRIYGLEYKIEQRGKAVSANSECHRLNTAGRLNEALTECREAIKFDPNFAEAHYNLGVVLRSMYGTTDAQVTRGCPDAMPEFQEAIRLGYTLNAYTLLGNCHFYLNDYIKAKNVIEEGMTKDQITFGVFGDTSGRSYAHCQLANAYYKLGEREKALTNYLKAKELGMVDPLLDNTINELRRALGR